MFLKYEIYLRWFNNETEDQLKTWLISPNRNTFRSKTLTHQYQIWSEESSTNTR